MPDAGEADYLLSYLWEIGPTLVAGMGSGPITHLELRAWQANSGIELQPWETRVLRRLSIEYLITAQKAEKADCVAPWQPVTVDRAVVADRLLQSIRALAGS